MSDDKTIGQAFSAKAGMTDLFMGSSVPEEKSRTYQTFLAGANAALEAIIPSIPPTAEVEELRVSIQTAIIRLTEDAERRRKNAHAAMAFRVVKDPMVPEKWYLNLTCGHEIVRYCRGRPKLGSMICTEDRD
jgi:hypothetical protein